MDSGGIRSLVHAHEEAAERRQRIQFISGRRLSRLIDVTGIGSILHFVDDPAG